MRVITLVFAAGLIAAACASSFAQQYSYGPRHTGEEVLDELLIGRNTLIVKVGTHGCTGKNSYRVDVRKEKTPVAPHYVLTIHRIKVDECKAIVDKGAVIAWDLEKDLGLKGNYTFSVRNMVYSAAHPFDDDSEEYSFLPIIKKQFPEAAGQRMKAAPDGGGPTEARP